MEQPNFSEIDKIANGDKAIEQKIIDVILKEFPVEKEMYFEYLDQKNNERIAAYVHKLKHKISILGLIKGYEVATTYEENLKIDCYDYQEDFEQVLAVITTYLSKL